MPNYSYSFAPIPQREDNPRNVLRSYDIIHSQHDLHPYDIIMNMKDNRGTNILMWACYRNYYELAKLCLDLGVDKYYKNIYGSDAYEFGSEHPRMIELLNSY